LLLVRGLLRRHPCERASPPTLISGSRQLNPEHRFGQNANLQGTPMNAGDRIARHFFQVRRDFSREVFS
jgi:hypothetical protein